MTIVKIIVCTQLYSSIARAIAVISNDDDRQITMRSRGFSAKFSCICNKDGVFLCEPLHTGVKHVRNAARSALRCVCPQPDGLFASNVGESRSTHVFSVLNNLPILTAADLRQCTFPSPIVYGPEGCRECTVIGNLLLQPTASVQTTYNDGALYNKINSACSTVNPKLYRTLCPSLFPLAVACAFLL